MRKTRRVRDNSIGNKRRLGRITRHIKGRVNWCILRMRSRSRTQPIPRLYAGSPAAHQDFLDALASLADLSALDGVEPRHEAWVLDHKGHELGRVAADAEELQAILLHKGLKRSMRGYANAVAVRLLEGLAEGHKRLDVAPRADNLDDDIQTRRGCLTGEAAEAGRDICWW